MDFWIMKIYGVFYFMIFILLSFLISFSNGQQILECMNLRDCPIKQFRCPGQYRKTIEKSPGQPYKIKCNKIECAMDGNTFEPGDHFKKGGFEYLCFVDSTKNTFGMKVTSCYLADERIPVYGYSTGHSGPYFKCSTQGDSNRFQLLRISYEDWLEGHGVDITHLRQTDKETDKQIALGLVKLCGSRLVCYGDGAKCSGGDGLCICPQNHVTIFMGTQSNGKLVIACKKIGCQVDAEHWFPIDSWFKYHDFQYRCFIDNSTNTYGMQATGCFTPINNVFMTIGQEHEEEIQGVLYKYECLDVDRESRLELVENFNAEHILSTLLKKQEATERAFLHFQLTDSPWNEQLADHSANMFKDYSSKIVNEINQALQDWDTGEPHVNVAVDLFKPSENDGIEVFLVVYLDPVTPNGQKSGLTPTGTLNEAVMVIRTLLNSGKVGGLSVDPSSVARDRGSSSTSSGAGREEGASDMQEVRLVARGKASELDAVREPLSGSESLDLQEAMFSECDECIIYRLFRDKKEL